MSQYLSGDWVYNDTLPGGSHWSMRMKRGTLLKLTDLKGGANVGMLFYNPENLHERYNGPDTLKCQHTFKLTQGHCLYSDMGRIFASIVEDDYGWHDTVCGNLNKTLLQEKWPLKTYQDHRNGWTQNGYDSFLVELAKYGLNRTDIAANLNFFSRVETDEAGNMSRTPNDNVAGKSIVLRFEMDTLVVMHTCPHPLDSSDNYPSRPVKYHIGKALPVTDDDECKNSRPENQRGFQNNFLYYFPDNMAEA